jgi:hypothetical protein
MSTISINGQSFTGNNIQIKNNKIFVDGEEVNPDDKAKVINISINGMVNNVTIDHCHDVEIDGNVDSVNTSSGDISISGSASAIYNNSGDVLVSGDIHGEVITTSGDVKCKNIVGDIKTVSGDIIKRIF